VAELGLAPAIVLGPHGRIVSIRFCAPGELRIRKIVQRSRFRMTIKYPSLKAKRMVQCESRNERNLCVLMEVDPKIWRYEEQPCEIVYLVDGEKHYHYPDFLVHFADHKELVEVKESAEAKEVHERTALLTAELPYYGFQYRVKIAEKPKQQPRLRVSEIVIKFGRRPISQSEREFVRRLFLSTPVLTWGSACAGEYSLYGRELLCRLVIEGVLAVDFNKPLSAITAFTLRRGACNGNRAL
jgi:hypothetical protein